MSYLVKMACTNYNFIPCSESLNWSVDLSLITKLRITPLTSDTLSFMRDFRDLVSTWFEILFLAVLTSLFL